MWQNRVLKGAFGAKVGRGLAVHVARTWRRVTYAEISVEYTKKTQHMKMSVNIKVDVKEMR
jgi:hypothetical protein